MSTKRQYTASRREFSHLISVSVCTFLLRALDLGKNSVLHKFRLRPPALCLGHVEGIVHRRGASIQLDLDRVFDEGRELAHLANASGHLSLSSQTIFS